MPGGFISRALYSLKWQLELLKILWSQSISLKFLAVFWPCVSREAWEADQQLVHEVRAGGEQRNPAAEMREGRGEGRVCSPGPAHTVQKRPGCVMYHTGAFTIPGAASMWIFFFFPLHRLFLKDESVSPRHASFSFVTSAF